MELIRFLVAPFIALYGLLALLAGPQQWRLGKLRTGAANALMLAGVILLVAAYLVWMQSQWALWVTTGGLLAMHVLSALNSAQAHGQIVWRQQLGRLLVSLVLLALAALARP